MEGRPRAGPRGAAARPRLPGPLAGAPSCPRAGAWLYAPHVPSALLASRRAVEVAGTVLAVRGTGQWAGRIGHDLGDVQKAPGPHGRHPPPTGWVSEGPQAGERLWRARLARHWLGTEPPPAWSSHQGAQYPGQQTDGQGTGQWSGAGEGAPSSQPARPRWASAECWAVISSGYMAEKEAGGTRPHSTHPVAGTPAQLDRGFLHSRPGWGARRHSQPVWGQGGPPRAASEAWVEGEVRDRSAGLRG